MGVYNGCEILPTTDVALRSFAEPLLRSRAMNTMFHASAIISTIEPNGVHFRSGTFFIERIPPSLRRTTLVFVIFIFHVGMVYRNVTRISKCKYSFFIIPFTLQLNSLEVLPTAIFWTSRGHRYRPFSPPARAFIFYRA